MGKRLLSLCMALALCLGLLPVTALAEGAAPDNLYVGDQVLPVGLDSYWTTSTDGKLITCEATNDWNVAYDAGSTTLTLKNATIEGVLNDVNTAGTGIYAASSSGPVSLNIVLVGENEVTGGYGINVSSEGAASLSISGSGSLTVSATAANGIGILVQAQSDANLTINGANVNAVVTETNGRGVELSTGQVGNPNLTIEVKGGSLQASGQPNGIIFFTNKNNTQANANLKVSGNAMVKTSGITTEADGSGSQGAVLTTEAGTGETGGIVWNGSEGTVYGSVTLQDNLEIKSGETLTIGDGASLTVPDGKTLTNKGTVTTTGSGSLTNNGTINNSGTLPSNIGGEGVVNHAPTITTVSLPNGTEGTSYSQTLTATGTTPITWSVTSRSLPAGLTLNKSTGLISGTPTTAGTSTFTVKAANDYGSDSKELSITINEPATISVTGVSLNQSALTLTEEETATLTATVQPADATNKTVTWKSSDTNIATVDTDGNVTAVAEGTATITVTTEDGNKTATCTVTVKHGNMVHTPKKDATCTEAGHTEYWTCETCGKYFSDENGTTEISQESTVIPAAGHTFRGGWCTVCGARDPSYVPPANPNYRVDVTTTEGGAVTKDPAAAKAGETVTLTPTPDAGYEVGDVTVTDRFGNAVEVTENADGTYTFTMPNGQVSVNVTFVEMEAEPLPFADVNEGDWFHDAVRYVYDNGLMDGVGDGQFAPNATTNRAMVVTILYRLAGEPDVSGDLGFTDVEPGLWYSNAVAWAAQKGIVNGISETEFSPSGDLTREQLATVLYRYAESAGYDVSAAADLSGFPDAGDIQDYAMEALSWAVAEGLLQGFEDDSLQPQSTATRAQIATILMRFCETVAK